MKKHHNKWNLGRLITFALAVGAANLGHAETIVKAPGNTEPLINGAAWNGGVAPGASDVALFTNTAVPFGVNTSFQLGGNTTWGQVALFIQPLPTGNNTTAIIDGNFTLTLNGVNGIGINNLSFQPPGFGNQDATLQFGSGVTVNAANSQIWQAVNRQINVNGVITGGSGTTITKVGNGGLQLGGGGAILNTFQGNLVLGGTGNTSLNSRWSNLSNLTVAGGTATINQNQTYGGYTGVDAINSSATLNLAGGNLAITGKTDTAVSQTFAGTTIGGGQSLINLNNQASGTTNSIALNLGSITRNAGGLLLFNIPGGVGTATLNSTGTAGMLKTANGIAWGIIGSGTGTNWAARDGSGNIVAYTGYTTVSGAAIGAANAGQDVELTSSGTVTVTSTALSTLKLNDTAVARNLSIGSGEVLKTGGILALSTTAATQISGAGTITALDGSQELTIISAGTQQLALGVAITDNAGGAVSVTFGGGTNGSASNVINVANAGTYTGDTYIAGGGLRMNSNTSGNANSTYHVAGNAALNVNNQNTVTIGGITGYGTTTLGNGSINVGGNNASTTYDGAFTGNAGTSAIIKSGTGTLRLTNHMVTNSLNFAGSVTVAGGTLLINGSLANASGTTVNTGATLGGRGALSSVNMASGAYLSPGDGGIGTLTATSLTLNTAANLVFDLNSIDNTSDLLSLSGAFTDGTGTEDLYTFLFSGGLVGETYTLVNFASTNFADVSQFALGGLYTGDFTLNANNLQFTLTAVPEPSTYAMVGAGLLGLWALRRRTVKAKA